MLYTEQITKGIQMLWKCMQGPNKENCMSCADKIKNSVMNLTSTIPNVSKNETFSLKKNFF